MCLSWFICLSFSLDYYLALESVVYSHWSLFLFHLSQLSCLLPSFLKFLEHIRVVVDTVTYIHTLDNVYSHVYMGLLVDNHVHHPRKGFLINLFGLRLLGQVSRFLFRLFCGCLLSPVVVCFGLYKENKIFMCFPFWVILNFRGSLGSYFSRPFCPRLDFIVVLTNRYKSEFFSTFLFVVSC
jgi:hypothetical protein